MGFYWIGRDRKLARFDELPQDIQAVHDMLWDLGEEEAPIDGDGEEDGGGGEVDLTLRQHLLKKGVGARRGHGGLWVCEHGRMRSGADWASARRVAEVGGCPMERAIFRLKAPLPK